MEKIRIGSRTGLQKGNRAGVHLLFWLVTVTFLFVALTSPAYAERAVREPQLMAKSAIVYCENTGEVVYSKNPSRKTEPFSITKLMTCLIAVQNMPLDRRVTVSKHAASIGESTMNLKAGEVVTVDQLVHGALIVSGNDAATALAEEISGGNLNKFANLMNRTAKKLGCTKTHFKNPSGLPEKGHYTSAEDFVKILRESMKNDVIRDVAGTKKYRMPATNKSKPRVMKTHLDLLKEGGSGIRSGKSGWNYPDIATIAVSYSKKGLNLYAVLLDDKKDNRPKDLKAVLEYSAASVKGIKVVKKGEITEKATVWHGAQTKVDSYAQDERYAYIPDEGTKDLIRTQPIMDRVKAPVKKGDKVGELRIFVGDEMTTTVPLLASRDVEEGWLPSYILISNRMTFYIGIILCILILILAVIRVRNKREYKRREAIRQRKIDRLAEAEYEKELERQRRNWTF